MFTVRPTTRYYRFLFAQHPLALEPAWPGEEMTLVSPDGKLTRLRRRGNHFVPMPGRPFSEIRQAVPFPADGQLYAWVDEDEEVITALISVYNPYDGPNEEGQADDEPAFSVMVQPDLPAGRWPRITGEEHFGPWFWAEYRAGRIILLDPQIPQFACLLCTVAHPAASCIIALIDLKLDDGVKLPAGIYAPVDVVQRGAAPARDDLDDAPWTDLAACFCGPSASLQMLAAHLHDEGDRQRRQPA
jgi:hypothetical protein